MPSVHIAGTASVSTTAEVGRPFRPLLNGLKYSSDGDVHIGSNVYIGAYCLIGWGVCVGNGTIVDDFSKLEPDVRIGQRNLITYGAQVCCDVVCGDDNIIGGFVGESTVIRNNCRIFGQIVHAQNDPGMPWDADESAEGAPTIEDSCFIGFGATVIGKVNLASQVYVASGALVTKHVPARTVVKGFNLHVPISEWPGPLKDSSFFKERR